MDEAVRRYIDGIDPAFRPLFDQIHELVTAAHPEATVTLSYQMPTYQAGLPISCCYHTLVDDPRALPCAAPAGCPRVTVAHE
jgi:hypothetical protein